MIRRRRRGERGSHACSPSYMTTAGPASLPDWPYKSTPALALDEGAHIGTVELLVSRPTPHVFGREPQHRAKRCPRWVQMALRRDSQRRVNMPTFAKGCAAATS